MRVCSKIIFILLFSLISCFLADAAKPGRQPVDTAGLFCRGVMETFPKVADNIEERLDFYRDKGLTHYFYCPSDDRYCNRWGWKILYNDSERHSLRQLRDLCQKKKMEFVWTVNPGERYDWKPQDYKHLLDKLILMYYDGYRSFAVDFTDHPGNHHAVRDSLDKHFVKAMKHKVSLYMIDDMPQVDYPSDGQTAVHSLMKGYHFSDSFRSLAKSASAILCNISTYDDFAKFAVVATADCAKDPRKYSADHSLADAIELLDGNVRDAFLTFLNHTGEDEESAGIEVFSLDTWSKDKSDALYDEFDRIEKVPSVIGANLETGVLEALKPWFVEFGRLGTRGKKVLKAMEYFKQGNIRDFWTTYLSSIISQQELAEYKIHPVGSQKLHPFYVASMNELKQSFTEMLTGGRGFRNLASTLSDKSNAALDSDFATFVSSEGHTEFAIPADANTCHLLLGPLPEGKRLFFRQIKTDGSLVAEYVVKSPSMTFDIKTGAVKVDVIGDVDIYECIFVSL
jgi:hyaluronoglucosaminidase